eukprot:INCI7663.3.p1 GENE.INCI7663.3~~INCI7663.3.p1  ORF type:complete len:1106 (-),score=163.20 INCI7663.3:812-4129(-)
MVDRVRETHDPSRSPALHFQEYILSSRRSSTRSTRSRAKRATPAQSTSTSTSDRTGFPRSNQYFEARAKAQAATLASATLDGDAAQGGGHPQCAGDRAARRGALRLNVWQHRRQQQQSDELEVAVEALASQRELGRFSYTPPWDPCGNAFTHALCQPSGASASADSATDAARSFAVAYVTDDSSLDQPLQFYVRTREGHSLNSAVVGVALPKKAPWKWRKPEDVRVFALEPLPARTRGARGLGGGLTFAFLACEHDQLWYVQLDVDGDQGSLSASDSVQLLLPREDLPADRRWQSRCTFGLYSSLMGPPVARSVSVAAVCSDEHSVFALVHFSDRDATVASKPLVEGDRVEVQQEPRKLWRTAVVSAVLGDGTYDVEYERNEAAPRASTVEQRVSWERLHRQNFTCYQFLRRTGKPMPEPRLRVASRVGNAPSNRRHPLGTEMHMELQSMVPSITRGEIFALFLTFMGRRGTQSLCRVRKLGVVGGAGDDSGRGSNSLFVREFELEEAAAVFATAALESEAVIVWTDERPQEHSDHRGQQVLYVTRADFPNDGVLQAAPVASSGAAGVEQGNPGGFVNALALNCGQLTGEIVVDATQNKVLARCWGGQRDGRSTLLLELGLTASNRHRDLMGLMAPQSYYVTQGEFRDYVFEHLLGSPNYPRRHLEQLLLKYNQLRLLGEYKFAGKSHEGPQYLEKVMERVKYAIDICQCLRDVFGPQARLPSTVVEHDLIRWTGIRVILGDMKIEDADGVTASGDVGGGRRAKRGDIDAVTHRELEFMDRAVEVLRSHAFQLHQRRHSGARDLRHTGPTPRGGAAESRSGKDQPPVGGTKTGLEVQPHGLAPNAQPLPVDSSPEEQERTKEFPNHIVVDAFELCTRYVRCLMEDRLTDRGMWCRAFDAADLLQRLLAKEQTVCGRQAGGERTKTPVFAPAVLPFSFYGDYVVLLNKLYFGLKTMDHTLEPSDDESDDAGDATSRALVTPRARNSRSRRSDDRVPDGVSLVRFERLVRKCVQRGYCCDEAASSKEVEASIRQAFAREEEAEATVPVSPLQLLIKIAPFKTVMEACAHKPTLVEEALQAYLTSPPVLTPARVASHNAPADFVLCVG